MFIWTQDEQQTDRCKLGGMGLHKYTGELKMERLTTGLRGKGREGESKKEREREWERWTREREREIASEGGSEKEREREWTR